MKNVAWRQRGWWLLAIACCLFLLAGNAVRAKDTEPYSEEEYAAVLEAVAAAEDIPASEFKVEAGAAILLEPVTGTIIYEQNSEMRMYPASMTKLMTLVLALEAVEAGKVTLEDEVTTSAQAASLGGSQVYLEEGEKHTLHEMLLAVTVGSANDASAAVAEYIGGTYEAFIKMMNEKAKELGMANTNYVNAHGLHDDNHVTTAKDMAVLSLYALEVPSLLDYTSIKETGFRDGDGAMVLYNTNKLLFWYEGTQGLKTGTTSEAGRCLAATAERDGLRLISVVMGGTVQNSHFSESIKLLNYGYTQFEMREFAAAGDVLTTADVEKGRSLSVDLTVETPLASPVIRGQDVEWEIVIDLNEPLLAPFEAGAVLGEAVLLVNGRNMATAPLVAVNTVEKARWYQIVGRFFGQMINYLPAALR